MTAEVKMEIVFFMINTKFAVRTIAQVILSEFAGAKVVNNLGTNVDYFVLIGRKIDEG